MSVLRQMNWQGQQRVDVPHLRSVDSAMTADFDLLAGTVMAGQQPLVVRGFNAVTTSAYGNPVSNLTVVVADGIVIHHNASEPGASLYQADSDTANEQLTTTNTKVSGAWTSGTINYVGVDFVRVTDSTTADIVQFIDPDTNLETPKSTPLARVLDYRFIISTVPFSATSNVCPLMLVTVSATGTVSAIQDARNLFYRLGSGGEAPDISHAYPWSAGRAEIITTTSGNPFIGGDKQILSMKEWMDAAMSRIWEVSGGTYWYSVANHLQLRMTHSPASLFTNGEPFEISGGNLHWQGLKVIFDNAGNTPAGAAIWNNVIADNLAAASVGTLAVGECVYVDLNRALNGASLTPQRVPLSSLGMSTIPGQRFVFAWRTTEGYFTRGSPYAVGSFLTRLKVAAASDFEIIGGPATLTVGTGHPAGWNIENWSSGVGGNAYNAVAHIPLPAGAIITGVEAAFNSSDVFLYGSTCFAYLSFGGGDTAGAEAPVLVVDTVIGNFTGDAAITTKTFWVSYAVTGTPTLPSGSSAANCRTLIVSILVPSPNPAHSVHFSGVRVTYSTIVSNPAL